MSEIRVMFHHDDCGNCLTTFKQADEERYYNRFDSGGWYTVYPSNGYWESDTRVGDDVIFIVIDNNGKEQCREHNGGSLTFQPVSHWAKQRAQEWAYAHQLADYDRWKEWLSADMIAHGYDGCTENWLYGGTETAGEETLEKYQYLGMDFHIIAQDVKHKICGKAWRYVFLKDVEAGSSAALCGFMY